MEENKDTKICPFCGEEIKSVAKKCRHCKSWLIEEKNIRNINETNEEEQNLNFENKSLDKSEENLCNTSQEKSLSKENFLDKCISNIAPQKSNIKLLKMLLIASIIFMAVFMLFISPTINKKNSQEFDLTTYKDKYVFKKSSINQNAPTLKEILQINNAENEMKKELEKPNILKGEIFFAYIDVLKSYIETYDYDQVVTEQNKDNIVKNGLTYKYVFKRKKESKSANGEKYVFNVGYYQIVKPMNESLLFSYFGEGYYSFLINYEYLYKTYAKYLEPEYQTYLKIKAKELSEMDYERMYSDGYLVVDESILLDGVLERERFLNKVESELKEQVKKEIKEYTEAIIWNKSTFDIETNTLTSDAKKIYEKFLSNADKSSEEYKIVNKAYNILKDNKFMFNEKFQNTCQKYTENEYQDYSDY